MGFQDQLSLTAGQKYCRMVPLEHSAILLTFIKLPFVITLKTFVLSIFEWRFYIGFTVCNNHYNVLCLNFIVFEVSFSGRVLDLGSKDCLFKTHWRHYVVSLSKTLYPLLSTGSCQEDRKTSQYD